MGSTRHYEFSLKKFTFTHSIHLVLIFLSLGTVYWLRKTILAVFRPHPSIVRFFVRKFIIKNLWRVRNLIFFNYKISSRIFKIGYTRGNLIIRFNLKYSNYSFIQSTGIYTTFDIGTLLLSVTLLIYFFYKEKLTAHDCIFITFDIFVNFELIPWSLNDKHFRSTYLNLWDFSRKFERNKLNETDYKWAPNLVAMKFLTELFPY